MYFAAPVAVVATLVVLPTLLGTFFPGRYAPFYFFGWWVFIPLFFLGLFFFFRCWGWGYWWDGGRYYCDHDAALETVRERFARGEITKDQYDQMRQDLETTR